MRLLVSELIKVRTAPRTILGLLFAELALVALGTASTVDSASSGPEPPGSIERDVMGVAAISVFFALLLGILVVTSEYRHGTITRTFLVSPKRERVVGVKALAAAMLGIGLTLPATGLALVIAEIWIGDQGFDLGDNELRLFLRIVLAAALTGALGVGIGAGLGRQLAAIGVALGWLLVAEPAVGILFDQLREYLPGHAIGGVLGPGDELLPFAKAAPVAAGYVLGIGALGLVATHRRDVT
jgi:ABC-2 type transport system permease protein